MEMEVVIRDLLKEIGQLKRELERISKRQAVAKNNFAATTAPGVADDVNSGFSRGSVTININTNNVYMCTNPAAGAAVWRLLN